MFTTGRGTAEGQATRHFTGVVTNAAPTVKRRIQFAMAYNISMTSEGCTKGEYVTLETALMRHAEEWHVILRRFFADAGNDPVRTFYDHDRKLTGYVCIVSLPDGSYRWTDVVTGVDVQVVSSALDDETHARIQRQSNDYEWHSMRCSGPDGVIRAAAAPEKPAE